MCRALGYSRILAQGSNDFFRYFDSHSGYALDKFVGYTISVL